MVRISRDFLELLHLVSYGLPGSYLHGPEISPNPGRECASPSLAYYLVGQFASFLFTFFFKSPRFFAEDSHV